ncbi:MAG: hypothetical protein WCS42_09975, partial [Verrucomicrobiota bacterium]
QIVQTTGYVTPADGIVEIRVNGVAITSNGPFKLATGTLAELVMAIAKKVASPYTAVAQGNKLYLSQLTTTSNDVPLDVQVILSAPLNSLLGIAPISNDGLTAIVSPNFLSFLITPVGGTTNPSSANKLNTAGVSLAALTGGLSPVLSSLFGGHPNMRTAQSSPIVVTCKPAGGFPPYKFQWQYQSGGSGFVATNENAPNTTFSRRDSAGVVKASWACLVTDATGSSVLSNPVEVRQP